MQVGRMVDRLASTTLSIFVRLCYPRLCVRAWSSCWNSFLYQSNIISHNGFHTFTPNLPFPGTLHYNLLTSTSTSNIQSYIHKSLFPQNRYQSSWPTTKAEQQKILHKTCSTPSVVKRILVHDYTSQQRWGYYLDHRSRNWYWRYRRMQQEARRSPRHFKCHVRFSC